MAAKKRGVRDAIQKPKSKIGKVTRMGKPIANKSITGVKYMKDGDSTTYRYTAGRGRTVSQPRNQRPVQIGDMDSSASRQASIKAARDYQGQAIKSRQSARRRGAR